jgi:hypothetical protein
VGLLEVVEEAKDNILGGKQENARICSKAVVVVYKNNIVNK